MKEFSFKQVAILGVGLVGGSVGLALKERGSRAKIVGVTRHKESLKKALEIEAIDEGTLDHREAVKEADLVILSTPVESIPRLAKLIVPFLKKETFLTDVGSVKKRIVTEIEPLVKEKFHFVGSHPMTGSEERGVEFADPYLFENALCIVTPTQGNTEKEIRIIEEFWHFLGSYTLRLSPEKHDRMVAFVSHLPHLIATSLVGLLGEKRKSSPELPLLAAGGFKDTTRVASASPWLWKDIYLSNRKEISRCIREFVKKLEELEELMEEGKENSLFEELLRGKKVRDELPRSKKGIISQLYEIVITCPDRPGVLAQITTSLAEKNINIEDVEVLRVREGEGGTIKLGFEKEEEVEEALRTLQKKGWKVRRR